MQEKKDTLKSEKVLIFLDQPNTGISFKDLGVYPDYKKILNCLLQGRELIEARFYVRSGYGQGIFSWKVQKNGWQDYWTNENDDVDSYIIQDMRLAIRERRANVIILASGDADYLEVVNEASISGINVEIFSFFDHRNKVYDQIAKDSVNIKIIEAYWHLDHIANWKLTRQMYGVDSERLAKAKAKKVPVFSNTKKNRIKNAELRRQKEPKW